MFTPRIPRILILAASMVVVIAMPVAALMAWKKQLPKSSPTARAFHAMAYDAIRQNVVLFGGRGPNGILGDTWVWNGRTKTWTRLNPGTSPCARMGHIMVYDEVNQRTVLFGGDDGQKFLNDTWEWDGANWKDVTPATTVKPRARTIPGRVYNSIKQRILLFGGLDAKLTPLNDTWEWDCNNRIWKDRTPSFGNPPARFLHAMALDMTQKAPILFGGMDTNSKQFNDTWVWDGNQWTKKNPATIPPVRSGHTMATDKARQRIVMFGGSGAGDTWEWNGTDWIQHRSATGPSFRGAHAMAYDSTRGEMVLFGGDDGKNFFDGTWIFAPTDLIAMSFLVSAATGGHVGLSLDAGSVHGGKTYYMSGSVDTGSYRHLVLGNVPVLLTPDWYFWFLIQFPNTLIAKSLDVLDSLGTATATVQVPPGLTTLIGMRFYHAYVVFKTGIDYASTPVPLEFVP